MPSGRCREETLLALLVPQRQLPCGRASCPVLCRRAVLTCSFHAMAVLQAGEDDS